jgi:predicted DNA-binding mobile mystery protein A
LDRRFNDIGPASRFVVPFRGWIKAIRESLGMSAEQVAKRLGISQPSVVAMEKSEAKGTIELATLRRAAAALNCTLVYALVPNKPLETIVRDRARAVARARRLPIEHSMLLEDQAVSSGVIDDDAQLDEFIRATKPARLWDEP